MLTCNTKHIPEDVNNVDENFHIVSKETFEQAYFGRINFVLRRYNVNLPETGSFETTNYSVNRHMVL